MIYHRPRPILYVDDTVEQRYAMRRILETEGYRVIEAGSGREALALLEQLPSLAVVDVRLPDVNGYDLTRSIKQRSPHLPVLQVSASFSDPNLRASGLSGGADAYIAQPVHPSELSALVRHMLQSVQAEESLRFLAGIGPVLSASLSLPETCANIARAVVPHVADRCVVMLHDVPGVDGVFWSEELTAEEQERRTLLLTEQSPHCRVVDAGFLIAPLHTPGRNLGTMGLFLNSDRAYTESDCLLASDLASRSTLALQNSLLLASENATRDALVKSEKLATAGRMAAAIAHEVNNPLEALTNLMYLIEQAPEAAPGIVELASTALAEITRLAHITHQTLGFYRDLKAPSTVNLGEVVAEATELYRSRLAQRSIEIVLELEPGLKISGIKGEIRQVVANLLVNAYDAMPEGGTITLSCARKADKAVLTVADDGPGIPSDMLPKVFEAFYSTKLDTGTGLGLWITRNIIEKHGGTIEVASRSGAAEHGTAFTLTFPLAKMEAERAKCVDAGDV